MVEYYPVVQSGTRTPEADSESALSNEEVEEAKHKPVSSAWPPKSRRPIPERISQELAQLGYYARSMKPPKGWLQQEFKDPKHVMINISESGIYSLLPSSESLRALISHGQRYLRRIYPRGTRIHSSNPAPLPFWRSGAHIVSLNWQSYDPGMQVNEAMFIAGPGWIVKPVSLRGVELSVPRRKRLQGKIIGISSLPPPKKRADKTFSIYVHAQLLHSDKDIEWRSTSVKTRDLSGSGADAIWDGAFEWEFAEDELAFLRLVVMENDFGRDATLAVFCARVIHLQHGWHLVRMLDMNGKNSGATLLTWFSIFNL